MAELPVARPAPVAASQSTCTCESEVATPSVGAASCAGACLILAAALVAVALGPEPSTFWADTITSTRTSKAKECGAAAKVAMGTVHVLVLTIVASEPSQVGSMAHTPRLLLMTTRYDRTGTPPRCVGSPHAIVTPPVAASMTVVSGSTAVGVVAARMVPFGDLAPQPHLFLAWT